MDEQNKSVSEDPDRGGEPSTTEIRSEIEHTRAEMGDTIDAIQTRLRPGNIVSMAADSMREATVGKLRQLTRRDDGAVPRRAADWYRNGVISRVRENPVPAAIAAASLAWLAFGKRPARDYLGPPSAGPSSENELFGSHVASGARVQRLTHEYTIAAGAIAAVLGMAVALVLPETERENALMGEARDSVVARATDAARGAAEKVRETVQATDSV